MATNGEKVLMRVTRYTPGEAMQFHKTYELKFYGEMTVLDALNEIKDTQDGTLTYRYSCRMGICGSCGMMVNGKPVLTCQTNIKDVTHPVRVEPLRNFPVIKDLVVDLGDAFEKMRSVMPYMAPVKKRLIEEGEYPQTPAQREKLDQTSQCIKCMLCYSACPVYGMNKNFVGPAAGALAYRYNVDSRDSNDSAQKNKRMDVLSSEKGIWGCSFIGECSTVCPKRVDPAGALQRLKVMGALHLGKKAAQKLIGKE